MECKPLSKSRFIYEKDYNLGDIDTFEKIFGIYHEPLAVYMAEQEEGD